MIDALHGDMRQRLREIVLNKFRQGQLKLLSPQTRRPAALMYLALAWGEF